MQQTDKLRDQNPTRGQIAIISPAEFPGNAGDTAYYSEIMNQLVLEGYDVFLICPKTKSNKKLEISKKIKVHRIGLYPPRLKHAKNKLGLTSFFRLILFLLIEGFSVWRFLKQHEIKHVLIRHHILTIHLPYVLKLLGITAVADGELIITSLEQQVGPKLLNLIKKYEKKALPHYKFFVVQTEREAKLLEDFGLSSKKLLVIPVSMNTRKIPKYPIEKIPSHTFGYFGRLDKSRGLDLLIDSFQLLLKKVPDATLYVIGDGPIKSELIKTVKQKNLESNIIFNSVFRQELWNVYFNKFQIVVVPTLRDKEVQLDKSLKLIESLAAGKPVIRCGHSSKTNGPLMTVKPNTKDTAKAMEDLCTDVYKLKEYSKLALELTKKNDIENTIKKRIDALYD